MDDRLILAIDQSTSATKAMFFDRRGRLVRRTDESHRQFYPRPGWVEHDPEEIFEKTVRAIRRLLDETGFGEDRIDAVAITNQRETALIWDRRTGTPVHNAVVWQCRRSGEICGELREKGHEREVREKTGLFLDPYFSAGKWKWILDHVDGARVDAEASHLAAGTIDSWLIWKLTGGEVHATDSSNACRTMIFDIGALRWDPDLCGIFSIPPEILPDVRPSSALFGHTRPGVVFARAVPLIGVMGDSHAACFGQNCFEPGMAKATYGTGSSIMMNIGDRPMEAPPGLVTSVGWALGDAASYVLEGNIHCAGDTIKWLVDGLELIPNSGASEEIAAKVEDNGGVYLVPAFVGLGAPYWDSEARASIWGMGRESGKAHVVRAALEAIAYQVRDLLDVMTSGAAVRLRELRVDGGATRNDLLMRFQADMLDVPVVRTQVEETSALGVAFMAGLGCGMWSGLEEIEALRRVDKTFLATLSPELREEFYRGWKEAVGRTLSGYRSD